MTSVDIDRTMFELLRRAVVNAGYLPDQTAYATEAEYLAAKEAIRASGKEIVDVFGVGSPDSRGAKTSCTIAIDRTEVMPGNVFTGGQKVLYKKDDGNFSKEQLPDSTHNIAYEIRCVANNTDYERLLQGIVWSVFGTLRDIALYDYVNNVFTTERLVVQNDTYTNLKHKDKLEYMFKYMVVDAWVMPTVELGTIVPLNTVEWGLIHMPGLELPAVIDSTTMDIVNDVLAKA